jgi:hypothetical protein
MKRLLIAAFALVASAATALADECRNNNFSPTFVRFNNLPGVPVHYVEATGAFTPMPDPPTAQATCTARGVRQPITGQDCRQRSWGDFGCGCNIVPSPNATCQRFHNLLSSAFGIDLRGVVMLGAGMLANTDLMGSDIAQVPTLTPLMCQQACQRDGRCASWTWARPSTCFLKGAVPAQSGNNCCVSGVVRTLPPAYTLSAGMVDNVNLPGQDYRSAPSSAPQACRTACQGDHQCAAWTWVKPPQPGGAGVCYFKSPAPPQQGNPCCISAIERASVAPATAITVVQATYGANCGVPAGNVTRQLAAACNGKAMCSYAIDVRVLGDPRFGCEKKYVARWQCSGKTGTRTGTVGPEAGNGQSINLSCN